MVVREPETRGVRLGDDPHDRPSHYLIPLRIPEVKVGQRIRGGGVSGGTFRSASRRQHSPPQAALHVEATASASAWEDRISEGNLTVKGQRATPAQANNMRLITRYARENGGGERAAAIGIATAIRESTCLNLKTPSYDGLGSYGLFQQQTRYWGTFEEITTVSYACRRFFEGLIPALEQGLSDDAASNKAQIVSGFTLEPWADEGYKAAGYFWGRSGNSAPGGGSDQNGGGEFKPYSFYRDKNEDSWDCLGRLAEEVRWRRFMRGGVLWYVSENWLAKQPARFKLREFSPGMHSADFSWDARRGTVPMSSFRANAAEASMSFDVRRYGLLPGDVVELVNMGTADGKWIATEINRTLVSPTAEVTLKRWQEKLKEPAPERKPEPERNPNVNGHPTPTTPGSGAWIWPVGSAPDHFRFRSAHRTDTGRFERSRRHRHWCR